MTDWTPQPFPFDEAVPVESQLVVPANTARAYPNAYTYHMDQYLHGDPMDRAGHGIAAVITDNPMYRYGQAVGSVLTDAHPADPGMRELLAKVSAEIDALSTPRVTGTISTPDSGYVYEHHLSPFINAQLKLEHDNCERSRVFNANGEKMGRINPDDYRPKAS